MHCAGVSKKATSVSHMRRGSGDEGEVEEGVWARCQRRDKTRSPSTLRLRRGRVASIQVASPHLGQGWGWPPRIWGEGEGLVLV
ncbi:hypothetical protein BJV77DRAFT_1006790, partial [Russula vinacea]